MSVVSVPAISQPPVSHPTSTLLPTPIAHAVSLATRSTGFAIRFGSLVTSCSLDVARFTTLSSLELARGMLEGVLIRAGVDPALRSRSDFADADAETVLERSLENLHHAVTQVVFWTAASFHLTSATISAVSGVSQMFLSSLDQLFGSTDSSRAIATIVTLIRREFRNPRTGKPGEIVGVGDLVLAFSALASLQQGCWRLPEENTRRQTCEEVIWDVVVLNDGERVDIQNSEPVEAPTLPPRPVAMGHIADPGDGLAISQLKDHIISSLAPGTTVLVSDCLSKTQTITVDVDAPGPLSLPTPPGAEIIEAKALVPTNATKSMQTNEPAGRSQYRVVYRIERKEVYSTSFQHEDGATGPSIIETPVNEWPHSQDEPPVSGAESPPLEMSANRMRRPQVSDRSRSAPAIPPSLGRDITGSHKPRLDDQSLNAEVNKAKNLISKTDSIAVSNQKKRRSPTQQAPMSENLKGKARSEAGALKRATSKKKLGTGLDVSAVERDKKNTLKQVLKEGSQSISNIWTKDTATVARDISPPARPQWKTAGSREATSSVTRLKMPRNLKVPDQRLIKDPRPPHTAEPTPRSSSRTSFVSVREHRRDSLTSQTESYMMGTSGLRRSASQSSLRSDTTQSAAADGPQHLGIRTHRRSGSHVPSLYSLQTNDSQTSLILSQYVKKSVYSASDAINTLRKEGFVDGTFPAGNLLSSITRYMRFSSASYGSQFLKMTGVSPDTPALRSRDEQHLDVRHFLHHTESDAGSVLLTSFVDPSGGSDFTGSTKSGVPLVHYISLDHNAKAVVLACRGTLGFEDILADLTCDYDDLIWRGRTFRVHKGIHASARRLLEGSDGRVLITLQEALREFPGYGLVLTGHSLGAGVAALLGVMLSEPNTHGVGFVTSTKSLQRTLSSGSTSEIRPEISLPTGRRIHVYAYGPPGTMSLSLCKFTKGLITSVVHGNDIVPHLSLGLLHDFQAMALAFKADETNVRRDLRARMWSVFQEGLSDTWRSTPSPTSSADEDRHWMLPALYELRKNMTSEKLLPPGEVFTIESQKVLRRDAFLLDSEADHLGKPAHRMVLKYVRDVPARFCELRFGTSMLLDHTPARYEEALRRLQIGIAD